VFPVPPVGVSHFEIRQICDQGINGRITLALFQVVLDLFGRPSQGRGGTSLHARLRWLTKVRSVGDPPPTALCAVRVAPGSF